MGERQALRIDYAHGTVPGTAFVIDEPFPIPPCAPRVPSAASGQGGGAGGVGLPPSGTWADPQPRQPQLQRGEDAPWRGLDWQPQQPPQQQPFFPDSGRFREDGAARRPNGSYMRGPFRGRGGRLDGEMANEGGAPFLSGRGQSQGMGGFRGRGFAGQRGGPAGGRGRGMGPGDTDGFRRGGDRGQRGPMNRGMRQDAGGPPRGRGRGMRGHGPEEQRKRGPPHAPFPQGKAFTPKPLNKHATPGKILTSQIPPLVKRPPVSKFRNRFPGPEDSSPSPSPPHGAKNNSTGRKPVPSAATKSKSAADSAKGSSASEAKRKSPFKDGASKLSPVRTTSRTRSPGKPSSKPRSPGKPSSKPRSPGKPSSKPRSPGKPSSKPRSPRKSSSRNRSPGGRRSSRTRSSSKSRSRRSRSRSRRRPRSRTRSPYRHRSRSRSPHRNQSPRITRSPYKPSSLLPWQEEGFGIRVAGFPVRVSDRSIQDGLYHEFKRHGKVVSVDMYGCAEDRYAVVVYQLPTEREAAMTTFKGHCFFGRSVQMEHWDSSAAGSDLHSWENHASFRPMDERADEFHPRATKILFVGNLEKTLTREDLSSVFNRYGEVLGIDLKKMVGLPNRFAFIQYIDIAGVCRAIKGMDGELLRNTRVRLGFGRSKPTNCVWVDGLPATLTEAQLTAHFSAHGTVLKLSFDPVKGVALVFFKTVEQAEAALQEARGQTVCGNRIKVDFANARSQAAFYRATGPGPEDGVDVEPEERPAPPVQEFKPSDIEAGDVLRKVLLV